MTTTEQQIRKAYEIARIDTATRPGGFVTLAAVRDLTDIADADWSATLRAMTRTGLVHLAPISNRKGRTDEDRASAVRIGSEDKHLIAIETED